MSFFAIGLIVGFIGSKLVNKSGSGFFLEIILGMVGAGVGGFASWVFGMSGVSALNLHSLLAAISGSVLVLLTHYVCVKRRIVIFVAA